MFVTTKTKDGKKAWRPAFIGFIKNNYLRRTLCIGFSPITFIFAVSMNILVLCIWFAIGFWRSVFNPLRGLFTNWKEIWHKPRSKDGEL